MSRRQRIDSVAGTGASFRAALAGEVMPPDHSPLPAAAMPFWSAIARGRTREEWDATPALLSTAASLAWTQWQIATLRGMFDGSVEMDASMKEAALVTRLLDLNRLEMAYLRTLQQHARGTQGEARDVTKRREAAKQIQDGVTFDDDLIPRPSVN